MTYLDDEDLDYIDEVMDYYNSNECDDESDLGLRRQQRSKYLEDERYRQLSDIFPKTSLEYYDKTECAMLTYYLAGNLQTSQHELTEHIRTNLTNPEINWKGVFDYMDERFNTAPEWLEGEVEEMAKYVNPYREQLYTELVFVGL